MNTSSEASTVLAKLLGLCGHGAASTLPQTLMAEFFSEK
jgi:hypothetical protein